MSDNGLLRPAAYRNPSSAYYLNDVEPVIRQPTLVSAIALQNPEGTSTGYMTVGTAAEGVYEGAISLQPGQNTLSPVGNLVGITVRAGTTGVVCEIGDNAQDNNLLYIAGVEGVAQVYDEKYNQPVSLQPITLTNTSPLAAPAANIGEIFRCVQAGVAASAAAAIGTNFQVPRSGWYALQIEVQLGNAVAPAAPDINVPITVAAGGVNLGETLTFGIFKGVVAEPYGVMEYASNEFAVADILVAGGNVVKQFVSLHLFEAADTYLFTLKSSSAVWNIGANGQIKAELIALC